MKKFLATLMMACLLCGTVSAFAQPTPGDDKKTETGDKDKKEHKGKKDKDKKDKDKDKKDKDEKKGDK